MIFSAIPLTLISVSAASERAASKSSCGDLKFYAPEQIYLYPNGESDRSSTATPFQFYINNTDSGAATSTYGTTGYIYYSYSTASSATLSYRFMNSAFATISGGSVSLSATSLGTSKTVSITGGTSPSLDANTSGCWIEWTLTISDSSDGQTKKAYAYTYVYKPYIVPVGGFARVQNSDGNSHYCQSITWISGVHSITVGSLHDDGGYYPRRNGDYGFASFITTGNTAYIGSTSYSTGYGSRQADCYSAATKYSGASQNKLAFVNTSSSSAAYFKTNPNNKGATNYGSTSSGTGTYSVRSMDYWYKKKSAYNVLAKLYSGASGNITIDTSRYTDLKQIPNLAVGQLLTDNESGHWGCWYIADATGVTTNRDTASHDGADSCRGVWDSKNYIIAGCGTSATNDSTTDSWDEEGVQYAGAWPRTILGSTTTQGQTYTYSVRGWETAEEDSTGTNDWAYNTILVDLNAKYYNKANLRSAVNRAINKMPALGVNGISSGSITSCFFDANTTYKWSALQSAYKAAVIALTQIDSTSNMNTLATNLTNALDALCTSVKYNANGGSLSSTSTTYHKIGTNQTVSVTPSYTGTRTGYTLGGWSTSSTGTAASSVTVRYNNTLYAIWTPNTYYVKFNANGGSGSMSNQTFKYGTSQALTSNAFTRTGYTFSGWATSSTGSATYADGASVSNLTTSNGATVNLYAVWTINKYYLDVNWDYTNASGTASVSNALSSGYGSADVYNPESTKISTGIGDFWQEITYNTTWKMVATVSDSSKYVFKNGSTYAATETRTGTIGAGNHGETFHIMPVYNIVFNGNGATSGSTSGITKLPWDKTATLTANGFGRKYTVTYNGNNGTPAKTSDTATATFNGWSTTAAGSKVYDNSASVSKLTDTAGGNFNLYAVWTLDSLTLPSATRTGYQFAGWYDGTTSAGAANASYTPSANKELKASWTANTYTVAYNGNGATSGSMSNSSHTYDNAKELTANGFTRSYTVSFDGNGGTPSQASTSATATFNGWATTAAGAKAYNNKATVTNLTSTNGATVTLYANWTLAAASLATASRTGYTFDGWYTAANGGTKVTSLTPTADTTLYAHWTANNYTVNYNGNGGTPAEASKTVTYDSAYGALITASRTGYVFAGWFTEASGGSQVTTATTVKITAAQTLYAHWTANSYVITFAGNGATSGSTASVNAVYDQEAVLTTNGFDRKYTVTFQTNGGDAVSPMTADYSFAGWSFGTESYDDGATVRNLTSEDGGSVTLTAKWSENGIVLPGAVREGYLFEGWYADAGFSGEAYTQGADFVPTQNSTFYAKWKAVNYTVSFDGNYNTSGEMSIEEFSYDTARNLFPNNYSKTYTVTYNYNGADSGASPLAYNAVFNFSNWNTKQDGTGVSYNDEASVRNLAKTQGANVALYAQWEDAEGTTLPAPGKTGYGFTGWYKDASATEFFGNGGDALDLTADIALYAGWNANSYKIKFNGNGATAGGTEEQVFVYDTAQDLNANGYERKYTVTFDYAGADIATGSETEIAEYSFDGWTNSANTYTDGQNVINLSSADNDELIFVAKWNTDSVSLPTVHIKTGHVFAGWYLDGELYTADSYTPAADKTFTAHWTPIEYSVEFIASDATDGTMTAQNFTYDVAAELSANAFEKKYAVAYDYNNGDEGKTSETAVYNFSAWTDGTNLYSDGQTVLNLSATADDTVFLDAVWKDGSVVLPATSRTGYSFGGWFNGTAKAGDAGENYTVPADNTTLKAKWTANKYILVLYNDEVEVTYDETIPDVNVPVKTGYIFGGYFHGTEMYYDENGIGQVSAYKLTSGLTLEPKWTPVTYTVAFSASDATSGAMSDLNCTYDVASTLAANTFARKYMVTFDYDEGTGTPANAVAEYSFACWKFGTETFADEAEIINLTDTDGDIITFEAQWTPNGVILPDAHKEGYDFNGWKCGDSVCAAGDIYVPEEDITVTALWDAFEYTVKFTAPEATSGAEHIQNFTYNVPSTLDTNTFKRSYAVDFDVDGADSEPEARNAVYAFACWSCGDRTFGDVQKVRNLTNREEELVFTAVWTPASVTLPEISKTGYTFDGWFTNASFDGERYNAGDEVVPESNMTFYAKWNINYYTVRFFNYDGTLISEQSIAYKDSAMAPDSPSKPFDNSVHYIFDGWTGYDDIRGNTDITATYTSHVHEWDEGTVTKWSTRKEEGNVCYRCLVCGCTKNEAMPTVTQETCSPHVDMDRDHFCDRCDAYLGSDCEDCARYERLGGDKDILQWLKHFIHVMTYHFAKFFLYSTAHKEAAANVPDIIDSTNDYPYKTVKGVTSPDDGK